MKAKFRKSSTSPAQGKDHHIPLADKLKVAGIFAAALGIPALMFHFACVQGQKSSVSKTVNRWRNAYGISDAQAVDIRRIELDYHGSGSPFILMPRRSAEDNHAHYVKIASYMPPDASSRFLEEMEKGCEK